ncbi:MAG: alpha/beta hydrolase, partial [Alistipes sp.]|nr:alpha/beta hydrolase [Alistipes sp.]
MRQFLTLLTLFLLFSGGATARQRGYVAVDEGRLYYEISGEGSTPLIFVHGHSLDRRMWREQVRFFEQHYRVIVYDARGYGRSSK